MPPLDLVPLEDNLAQAGFDVSNGIGTDALYSMVIYTYDESGQHVALPPAAQPIVESFFASQTQTQTDHLATIKAVPLGSTTDELRDALVAYLESKFGALG
jgi:hypothetical protein